MANRFLLKMAGFQAPIGGWFWAPADTVEDEHRFPHRLHDILGVLQGVLHGPLGLAPLGDVPEDQDYANDPAAGVPDRGGAVVNRPFRAVLANQ